MSLRRSGYQSLNGPPSSSLGYSPMNVLMSVITASAALIAISALIVGAISLYRVENGFTVPWLRVENLSFTKPDPSKPGPYDVGFHTVEVTLSGILTNMTIWYPVEPSYPTRRIDRTDKNCRNTYPIDGVSSDTGTRHYYTLPSGVCAERNAPMKAGSWPVHFYLHGYNQNLKNYLYLSKLFTHEILASHGFISVAYERTVGNPVSNYQENFRQALDYTFNTYPYADKTRVGMSCSSGGCRALAESYTIDVGVVRLNAVILEEPSGTSNFTSVTGSVLLVNRTSVDPSGIDFIAEGTAVAYDALVNAARRSVLQVQNFSSHVSLGENIVCHVLARQREYLLAGGYNDPALPPPSFDFSTGAGAYAFGAVTTDAIFSAFYFFISDVFGIPPMVGYGYVNDACRHEYGVGSTLDNSDKDSDLLQDPPSYIYGAVTSATNNTVVLPAAYYAENFELLSVQHQAKYNMPDTLNGYKIAIVSGTGFGQVRIVSAWTGTASYEATLTQDWTTNPDATSVAIAYNTGGTFDRTLSGEYRKTANILSMRDMIRICNHYHTTFFGRYTAGDASYSNYLLAPNMVAQPEVKVYVP